MASHIPVLRAWDMAKPSRRIAGLCVHNPGEILAPPIEVELNE
jgi:hypothetical protein